MSRIRLQTSVHPSRLRHASLLTGLILLLGTLLVFFVNSITTPYIDTSFSYSADLQTTINTFDQSQNRFEGEQYGLTTFSIEQLKRQGGAAYLQNTTKTSFHPHNSQVSSNQRYTVQIDDGQHINTNGDAAGYLFAPRNSKPGASYTLWFAPYGRSVPMRYINEESIGGLTTYVYTASFAESDYLTRADSNEPLVYQPRLKLWIEPTSGWLIKYQEENASFAIKDTIKIPSAYTSSISTDASVRQHVAYAKQLKYQLNLGLYVAPTILLIAILVTIFVLILKLFGIRSLPIEITAAFVFSLCATNIIGWLWDIGQLRTVMPGDIALSPLASICFMLVALSLLLLYHRAYRRIVLGCGIAIIIIATFAFLYRASIISFDIRSLLFSADITTADRGISLFGTLVFYLLGFSLIKIAYAVKNTIIISVTKLMAGMATCLGIAGLLGKVLLLDQVFVVPFVSTLSISASLLSALCGLSLLQVLIIRFPYSDGHRQSLASAILKPAVLTLPLVLIGIFAQLQQNVVTQQVQRDFDKQATELRTAITDTLSSYTNTLVGAQALFGSSISVEKNEWQSYIEALRINKNLPGVEGIGYAPVVQSSNVSGLVQKMKTVGSQNYALYPTSTSTKHAPIIYIEPATEQNLRTLGFDMETDPIRRNAMAIATQTASPTLSAKAYLLQETATTTETGFFLFLPIFTHNMPLSTIEERTNATEGYVYAPFNASMFFTHALRNIPATNLKLSVYDGIQKDASSLLYAYEASPVNHTDQIITTAETIVVNNRLWTLVYDSTIAFDKQVSNRNAPGIILVGGSLAYITLLILYTWLITMQRQVRAAKPHKDKSEHHDRV